jgi:hypothetical protein
MALPPERSAQLMQWEQAPAARMAHPREEHLLPLMVVLGAAEQEAATVPYHEDAFMGGLAVSSFRFGASRRCGNRVPRLPLAAARLSSAMAAFSAAFSAISAACSSRRALRVSGVSSEMRPSAPLR